MTKPSSLPLYFIDNDNDTNWYLVPTSQRAAWEKWIDNPETDMPSGVTPIDSPSSITFPNWTVEGVKPINPPPVVKAISLTDLVGKHTLKGVDIHDTDENKLPDNIRFQLGDKTYLATEDPSDGYRSYMDGIVETNQKCKNLFRGVKVLARMSENTHDTILEVLNAKTGKTILCCGTSATDDYYPSWTAAFNEENL